METGQNDKPRHHKFRCGPTVKFRDINQDLLRTVQEGAGDTEGDPDSSDDENPDAATPRGLKNPRAVSPGPGTADTIPSRSDGTCSADTPSAPSDGPKEMLPASDMNLHSPA